jgi:FtsP/CotA-like multicopper oxidase with cupredoxin domain
MGISRSFILYMNADQQNNATVPWTVIGSDAGLSLKPVVSDTLTISIAERWEVVVDFAQFAGQNVTVKNQRNVGADEDYAGTDRLMSKSFLNIYDSSCFQTMDYLHTTSLCSHLTGEMAQLGAR